MTIQNFEAMREALIQDGTLREAVLTRAGVQTTLGPNQTFKFRGTTLVDNAPRPKNPQGVLPGVQHELAQKTRRLSKEDVAKMDADTYQTLINTDPSIRTEIDALVEE